MAQEKAKSNSKKSELPKYDGGNEVVSDRLPGAFELPWSTYQAIKRNLSAYMWLVGLPLVIATVANLVPAAHKNHHAYYHHNKWTYSYTADAFFIVVVLLGMLAGPGAILLQIKSVNGETNVDALETFKKGLHYFWRLLGLAIILGVILSIAFILFILPFLYLLPRVMLAPYFLLDRDMSISDALSASWNSYKKYKQLWGVIGVWFLVIVISSIKSWYIGVVLGAVFEFFYSPSLATRYEQYKLLDAGKPPRTPIEIKTAKA